jgi:hypothetical protein
MAANTIIHQLRDRKTYLTTSEVMAIIRKSRNTLCGYVRDGVLSAIRMGDGYLFDPQVIADWLDARVV